MSVVPLTLELSASGQNNKATLTADNDTAAPVAVEVVVSKLTIAEDGTSTSVPVKGKFMIFPPQATIPSNASQAFRVQWLGGQDLKASETYTISVNQLPVVLDKNKSGLQFVYNFSVVVNVAPVNAAPVVSVISTDIARREDLKENRPAFTVKNSGNGHAALADSSIVLTSGSWTQTVPSEQIQALMGIGLIQPGAKRRFILPVPLPPEISRYNVRIDFKRPR